MWERLFSRDLNRRVEMICGWKAAPTFNISVYSLTLTKKSERNF